MVRSASDGFGGWSGDEAGGEEAGDGEEQIATPR